MVWQTVSHTFSETIGWKECLTANRHLVTTYCNGTKQFPTLQSSVLLWIRDYDESKSFYDERSEIFVNHWIALSPGVMMYRIWPFQKKERKKKTQVLIVGTIEQLGYSPTTSLCLYNSVSYVAESPHTCGLPLLYPLVFHLHHLHHSHPAYSITQKNPQIPPSITTRPL